MSKADAIGPLRWPGTGPPGCFLGAGTVHGVGLPDEIVDAVEPGGDVRLLAVDNLPGHRSVILRFNMTQFIYQYDLESQIPQKNVD